MDVTANADDGPLTLRSGDSLTFARTLVEAVATGSGAMGHALLTAVANRESLSYWRIQTTVGTCSFAMHDSTPENVACLSARGANVVAERGDDLDAIAAAVSV